MEINALFEVNTGKSASEENNNRDNLNVTITQGPDAIPNYVLKECNQ